MHIDLLVTYHKYIIQHNLCGATMNSDFNLTYTTMINPETGWFEVVKVPTYDLDEATGFNITHIDKSSARII